MSERATLFREPHFVGIGAPHEIIFIHSPTDRLSDRLDVHQKTGAKTRNCRSVHSTLIKENRLPETKAIQRRDRLPTHPKDTSHQPAPRQKTRQDLSVERGKFRAGKDTRFTHVTPALLVEKCEGLPKILQVFPFSHPVNRTFRTIENVPALFQLTTKIGGVYGKPGFESRRQRNVRAERTGSLADHQTWPIPKREASLSQVCQEEASLFPNCDRGHVTKHLIGKPTQLRIDQGGEMIRANRIPFRLSRSNEAIDGPAGRVDSIQRQHRLEHVALLPNGNRERPRRFRRTKRTPPRSNPIPTEHRIRTTLHKAKRSPRFLQSIECFRSIDPREGHGRNIHGRLWI
jgi:hypothetical protein